MTRVVEPMIDLHQVQPKKILERIDNSPAGEEVDRNVELVLGWHIGRIAVPLENTLVD
jgi:hypothetical protein